MNNKFENLLDYFKSSELNFNLFFSISLLSDFIDNYLSAKSK
jgi:hypothetical protein